MILVRCLVLCRRPTAPSPSAAADRSGAEQASGDDGGSCCCSKIGACWSSVSASSLPGIPRIG